MDKATAEKLVNDLKAACLLFEPGSTRHFAKIDNLVGQIIEALTQPPVEAKPQGDPKGFVQCQDKGWHKDMGDHYNSECLTKEAAIGDCTEAELDELAKKSEPLFRKMLEKAVREQNHAEDFQIIRDEIYKHDPKAMAAVDRIEARMAATEAARVQPPTMEGHAIEHCTCPCNCIDPLSTGFVKVCKECFNGDHLAGYLGKREAARVPPEAPSKPDDPLHEQDGSQRVPKGFKKIEAYTDYKTVVIMGDPYLLDGDNHNCDAMGCGSMGHVMARMPILPDGSPEPTDRLLEAAKAVLDWYDENPKNKISKNMHLINALRDAIKTPESKSTHLTLPPLAIKNCESCDSPARLDYDMNYQAIICPACGKRGPRCYSSRRATKMWNDGHNEDGSYRSRPDLNGPEATGTEKP